MKPIVHIIVLLATLAIVSFAQQSCAMEGEETAMTAPSLLGSTWWVEDIAGRGVIDMSHTTIGFPEAGRVEGDTACNRYFGGVDIDADTISFGQMAVTERACTQTALMKQESKFLRALSKVTRWRVAVTGLLHLDDDKGKTWIRAVRTED